MNKTQNEIESISSRLEQMDEKNNKLKGRSSEITQLEKKKKERNF